MLSLLLTPFRRDLFVTGAGPASGGSNQERALEHLHLDQERYLVAAEVGLFPPGRAPARDPTIAPRRIRDLAKGLAAEQAGADWIS